MFYHFFLVALLLAAPVLVTADCECGYSLNTTSDPLNSVFTEVLESDFTVLKNITYDTDWVPQEWEVDKVRSKGPYGRKTCLGNVISNPAKDRDESSLGKNGDESGLELWVRKLQDGEESVSVAEVDTARTDMIYGSFRTSMQITKVNGTCAAFFWYLNDTQEIDMEFLSSEMTANSARVNLVLHSDLTMARGGDAQNTPGYKVIPLLFDPTDGFHEYRFDWKPGSVTFYADGVFLHEMTDEYVPETPGKIVLSHWSNGQRLWSGGPPEEDAKVLVQYVKAYFNSTDEHRAKNHAKRCKDPGALNAICEIPNQNGPPKFNQVYFFHQDKDKTKNQSIYGLIESNATSISIRGWIPVVTTLLTIVIFGIWDM